MVLTALAGAGGTYVALGLLDRAGKRTRERADRLAGADEAGQARRARSGTALRRIAGHIEPLVREGDTRALERLLWQAGMPYSPAEFLVSGAIAAAVGLALGHLLFGLPGLLGAFAGGLPYMTARRRAVANLCALSNQLPDALLLLVNALRSGHGLMQALRVVATQAPKPIGTEISALLDEINWGVAVETALTHMSGRIGLVDVDLAVGAILVQRETGGNLAEILTNLQETLRDRARVAGEVHALTAQGRLSGWVLSLLPVGVGGLFMLVNPSYLLPFFADPRGQSLLAGAGFAQLLGIFAIRRMIDVKY
jgi:tight adherence protein B